MLYCILINSTREYAIYNYGIDIYNLTFDITLHTDTPIRHIIETKHRMKHNIFKDRYDYRSLNYIN